MFQNLRKGNGFESSKGVVTREAVARCGGTCDATEKAGQRPFAAQSRVNFSSLCAASSGLTARITRERKGVSCFGERKGGISSFLFWCCGRLRGAPRIGQSRRDPFNKGDLDGSELSAQRDRFLM